MNFQDLFDKALKDLNKSDHIVISDNDEMPAVQVQDGYLTPSIKLNSLSPLYAEILQSIKRNAIPRADSSDQYHDNDVPGFL